MLQKSKMVQIQAGKGEQVLESPPEVATAHLLGSAARGEELARGLLCRWVLTRKVSNMGVLILERLF